MDITKEQIQMGIFIVQGIAIPLFLYILRKLVQVHRGIKLANFKHIGLVKALSKQYGNGDFEKDYLGNVEQLKSDHNFVYKE